MSRPVIQTNVTLMASSAVMLVTGKCCQKAGDGGRRISATSLGCKGLVHLWFPQAIAQNEVGQIRKFRNLAREKGTGEQAPFSPFAMVGTADYRGSPKEVAVPPSPDFASLCLVLLDDC